MDGLYLADKMREQLEKTRDFYNEQVKIYTQKIDELNAILEPNNVVEEESLEMDDEPAEKAPTVVAPSEPEEQVEEAPQQVQLDTSEPRFNSMWGANSKPKGVADIRAALEPYPNVEIVNPNAKTQVQDINKDPKKAPVKEVANPQFESYNMEIDIVDPKKQAPVAQQPAPVAPATPKFESYNSIDIQMANPNGVAVPSTPIEGPTPTYVQTSEPVNQIQ